MLLSPSRRSGHLPTAIVKVASTSAALQKQESTSQVIDQVEDSLHLRSVFA